MHFMPALPTIPLYGLGVIDGMVNLMSEGVLVNALIIKEKNIIRAGLVDGRIDALNKHPLSDKGGSNVF